MEAVHWRAPAGDLLQVFYRDLSLEASSWRPPRSGDEGVSRHCPGTVPGLSREYPGIIPGLSWDCYRRPPIGGLLLYICLRIVWVEQLSYVSEACDQIVSNTDLASIRGYRWTYCRIDVDHASGAELSHIENVFLGNEHPTAVRHGRIGCAPVVQGELIATLGIWPG